MSLRRPSGPSARRARRGGPREDPAADAAREALERMREDGWVLPPSLARDDVVPTWTRLGVVDGATTAVVDSRGLVTPVVAPGHGSIDWWIGAEDRWYAPARESGITQVRLDGAPVVETTLRVPGGEVVHRAYGARGPVHLAGDAWIVVEVENRSPVPVVLAWVVRPYSPAGPSGLTSVRLRPPWAGTAEGAQVIEAGGTVGVLRRPPSRSVASVSDDPWDAVPAGGAVPGPCPDSEPTGESAGLASVALLTPLPHTATARLALVADSLEVPEVDAGSPIAPLGYPADLPDADSIARGWATQARRGPRVDLPDPVLADAVAAARLSLPLCLRVAALDDGDERRPFVTAGTGLGARDSAGDAMEITAALAWWGDGSGAGRVLARWPETQQRGGGFGSAAATAAALEALATHVAVTGDIGPVTHWLPEVGGALEHLGRASRRGTDDERRAAATGLAAGGLLLRAVDQPASAAELERVAQELKAASPAPSAGPADAPGTATRALAAAAVDCARAGAPALALWAVLRRASATWTWSDSDRWVGDDGLVTARVLRAVSELLVGDEVDGLALTRWVPPEWWGQGWEVHDAPTRWGRASYAVRWHSGRPALLWEIHGDVPGGPWADAPLRITAPGLDPSWSSTERRGEALLAPIPAPPEAGGTTVTGATAITAPPRSVWRPQDPGPDSVRDRGPDGPSSAEEPSPPPPADGGGDSFL